jgi:hypothetical protein
MKYRSALFYPLFLAGFSVLGAQASGCNGSLLTPVGDGGADGGDAAAVVGDEGDEIPPLPPPDASTNCTVNPGEDFIDFCLQKKILIAEHALFSPTLGLPSSWSANTGKASTDGGVILHDVNDDVAYGSSLSLYAISALEYGDTDIQDGIVAPDLAALAPLVEAELTQLPASYDGEIYMRLRRFAAGLRIQGPEIAASDATVGGTAIDAIADAYGRAIYATYFHPLASPPGPGDAGSPDGAGDAGEDAALGDGGETDGADGDAGASDEDAGDAGPDANLPELQIPDGILGVPLADGGILYNVDQAASGALALVDLASRHAVDDPAASYAWASAAVSVFSHIYTRAQHSSGLYYTYLVTSADPGHDALPATPILTPGDALLAETQTSVAASLLRAYGIVHNANTGLTPGLLELSAYPFSAQAVSPLSGLKGVAPAGGAGVSLWDPTSTAATAAACSLVEDASACGGSGFFLRYLPSSTGLDNSEKTIRANALAFAAIHRSLVLPGSAASIDWEVLSALFQTQQGIYAQDTSFLSQIFNQVAYPSAVTGSLALLAASPNFTAQANAYAIEALTEQWIGQSDCPTDFF